MTTELASRPTADDDRHVDRRLVAVTVALVAAFAALALVFVFRGRLNADEGWYLDGGRLAWHGQLPYRDFAFTQMPLTAYVYGLLQAITASVFLGRLTSVVFAVAAVALCARVAWREAGAETGAAVALLCVAIPVGVYNLTIVKTYAPSAFFLAAVLAALTSPGRPARTWTLATLASFGLLLTRTTGLPVTVLVVLFCILRAPDHATRRNVSLATLAGALASVALPLTDPSSARYNLVTFHNLLWHGADSRTKIDEIVHTRLPDWLGDYPAYVALAALAVVAVYVSPRVREYLRRQPGIAVVGVGAIAMLVAQLGGGEWAPVEYFTPAIPVLLTVTTVVLVHAVRPEQGWATRRLVAGVAVVALVAVAVTTLVHPGVGEYFTAPDDPGSVQQADRVGDYLAAHTHDGDRVLTMWAQPSGLVSSRAQVDGVTMGVFSYEDLSVQQADDYHFVNRELLLRMLRRAQPAAVVFTGVDDLAFHFTGSFATTPADPREIYDELAAHYRLARRSTAYGVNGPTWVRVYLRDDR